MHNLILKTSVLFLYFEMTAVNDVSYFLRVLSYVYVNFWIPIRLWYLRLKIALRPIGKYALEGLAFLNIVWSIVPISILAVLGEIISGISKEWLRLSCLLCELASDAEPGSLFEHSADIFVDDDEEQVQQTESVEESQEDNAVEESRPTNTMNEYVDKALSNEGFHDANEDGIRIE